ncbi:MAG: hypothetical protein JWO74_1592 [Solirubrobacterales bacterium]|nr:hypothetical protein [Solirubrobacterales bacterium]
MPRVRALGAPLGGPRSARRTAAQPRGRGALATALAKLHIAVSVGKSGRAAWSTSARPAGGGSSAAGTGVSSAGVKAAVAAIVLAGGGAATAAIAPRDDHHPRRPVATISTSARRLLRSRLTGNPSRLARYSDAAAPTPHPDRKKHRGSRAAAITRRPPPTPQSIAPQGRAAPVPAVAQPRITSTSSGGPSSGELGVEG